MKHILRVTLAVMVTAGLLMGPAAEAHVRKAPTSLSLKASKTKVHKGHKVTFTIHLKSAWSKCVQQQPIKWFKNGVYKKTVTTNNNGVVTLTKKMHHSGTFRAKYLGRRWGKHPHRHVCYASQSKGVFIKVKGS